jgi:CheY-like chemotaxis protein
METSMNSVESSQLTDTHTTKSTILLIDNDIASYFLVYEILTEYGIEVIHARCGIEGVELFKVYPSIQLVITELLLPQLNGFDVLNEIKKLRSDIPVITQTANVMNNMKQTCLDAGFDEFIPKPFDISYFVSVVNMYIQSKLSVEFKSI